MGIFRSGINIILLTAKADMATAARTSNAAFEQFEDHAVLFGPESQFKSEHLQETEVSEKATLSTGLVDRMERYEKEGIIQVKCGGWREATSH